MENDRINISLISDGKRKLKQNQFKAAIGSFLEALKHDSGNGYLYYLLANAYHDWYCSNQKAIHIKEAAKFAKLALHCNPNNAFTQCMMGIIFLRLRKKLRAREHLKQAIALDPSQAIFHCRLGESFNPKKQALKHYMKALQLDPNCMLSLLQLSHYYFFVKNDPDKSCEYTYQALKLDPMQIDALTMMGHILYIKGNYIEAKEHAALAINQDPMNQEALKLICLLESKNIFIKAFYKLGLWLNKRGNIIIFYLMFIPLCLLIHGLSFIVIFLGYYARFAFDRNLKTKYLRETVLKKNF